MEKGKKIILILIILIVGYSLFKTVRTNVSKNSYDYIIVGTNCSTGSFSGSNKYTYGIKNGKVKEISNDFSSNKSNINRIVKSNDMITYFSYDTWYDMYDDLGKVDYCNDCTEKYNETVKNAHDKYDYKEKDLKAFNSIMDILDDNDKNFITYFIITDNNYYIFAFDEGHKVFKYNEANNSLDLLLDLKTCSDIDYFYEK